MNRHRTEYLSQNSDVNAVVIQPIEAGEFIRAYIRRNRKATKKNVNNAHKHYNLTLSLCSKTKQNTTAMKKKSFIRIIFSRSKKKNCHNFILRPLFKWNEEKKME